MYQTQHIISMKAVTITTLFVAAVLLTWIGAVSENQVDASVNWRDNPERFDGGFDFWDMFIGFAWWGVEESGLSIFDTTQMGNS